MNHLSMNRRQARHARRGVTLLIVLLVVSLGLAVSYAVLHTQGAAIQLQRNSDRQNAARQAALAGLTTALGTMHRTAEWKGVGSTLSGSLNTTDRYSVTYTAGDASLTSSQPEYGDYPYRVTLVSTGYAQDASQPTAIATYQVRAVVRLVPKQLAAEPPGWNVLDPYALYQWRPDTDARKSRFIVEFPSRIEGKVRVQRELRLCEADPDKLEIRQRLLRDLQTMNKVGEGDHRPFSGDVHLPFADTPASTRALLTDELGLTTADKPTSNEANWDHPGAVTNYQIYPGGPTYNVPTVGPTLQNITLQPDPMTNPLGIFYYPGRLYVYDNVTVRGTLITDGGQGDIYIYAGNFRLESVNLPALSGTTAPIQLPAAVVGNDLGIWESATGSISGMVVVWHDVEFRQGPQKLINFTIAGRLVAKEVLIRGRNEWTQPQDWWKGCYQDFQNLVTEPFFPNWLAKQRGLLVPPRVRIQPATSAVTYHWKNNADPVYVPHANDEGLRWDLLEWTEDPK
jgi:hypothetical protein